MNRLMVKPMPHNSATAKNCMRLAPSGRLPQPSRNIKAQARQMPSGLPMSKPSAMPMGTPEKKLSAVMPPSGTPALQKANTGSTPNATHGCSACSICNRGDSPAALRLRSGIASAQATPASVACTPDLSTQTHSAMPIST